MADTTPHVSTIPALRDIVRGWRSAGHRIVLVPTMGALHDGHFELVRSGRRHGDKVVASIFVNPRQFAPHEDLDRYPRTFEADLAGLATAACDLVWAPTVAEMYSAGHATQVVPSGAALGLETDFRPHFFAGVATVCTKLFSQVTPDVAIFGEKDFQQLAVMRQIVRDLDLPLAIIGAPTIREPDGLAMSSRNRYLSDAERKIAPSLHRALQTLATGLAKDRAKAQDGLTTEQVTRLADAAGRTVLAAGFAKLDYIAVRDATTMAPFAPDTGKGTPKPLRILAAAWLGKTRLIDNIAG